jgi:hypothetical protein
MLEIIDNISINKILEEIKYFSNKGKIIRLRTVDHLTIIVSLKSRKDDFFLF